MVYCVMLIFYHLYIWMRWKVHNPFPIRMIQKASSNFLWKVDLINVSQNTELIIMVKIKFLFYAIRANVSFVVICHPISNIHDSRVACVVLHYRCFVCSVVLFTTLTANILTFSHKSKYTPAIGLSLSIYLTTTQCAM